MTSRRKIPGVVRERIRCAVFDTHQTDPRWPAVCQRAYRAVQAAMPADSFDGPTPIEPYGHVDGYHEWRTYGHSRDGLSTWYAVIREYPEAPATEINLDRVVELVKAHGVEAYVEQTGGGCAAIYAGATRPEPCDCSDVPVQIGPHLKQCVVNYGDYRWAAMAGPGWYGWHRQASTGDLLDFYVGPDDPGETEPVSAVDVGAVTEEDIATLIVAQALREHPEVPLDFDTLDALGFDGTGMGMRRRKR